MPHFLRFVAAAWLGSAAFATAAVVYTPLVDPFQGGVVVGLGGSGPLNIDFDGNGTTDVTLRRLSSSHYQVEMTGATRIIGVEVSGLPPRFDALNLQKDFQIGSSFAGEGIWTSGNEMPWNETRESMLNQCLSGGGELVCAGNFFSSDPFEYLGVEFEIDGVTHYGWVEIESHERVPRAEIHGFAYESVPGASILAGQIPEPSAVPLFEVTILPFPAPGDLNNAGEIVGIDATNQSVFFWNDGVTTTIAAMPAAFPAYAFQQQILAVNISENGLIVGQISGALPAAGRDTRAVAFDGLATDLGALTGSTSITGAQSANLTAINSSGVAVGNSTDSTGTSRPVIFTGGLVTQIGSGSGVAHDINNAGQIVGLIGGQGFLTTGVSPTILAALPGHVHAIPASINQAGVVVGRSRESVDVRAPERAVMWNNGAAPVDLGLLPGSDRTVPTDINASHEIVGNYRTIGTFSFSAYYQNAAGTYYKLNDMLDPADPDSTGLDISLTKSINDDGWILARGTKAGMGTVGVLLKPVMPIPVLLVLGTSLVTDAGGGVSSFTMSVPSRTGFDYQLERSTDGVAPFTPIGEPVTGIGAALQLTDSAPPSGTALYKVAEFPVEP